MLVYRQNGSFLKSSVLIWWPQTTADVTAYLPEATTVALWQCPVDILPALRRWVFRVRPFCTPLLGLQRTEEQLWQNLEPKSCRYEIRKAQKLPFTVSRNEPGDAARLLMNDSIRRLRYRHELCEQEWRALLPDHDIFVCRWEGEAIAAHVLLRDPPRRARLILSGGVDRGDPRFHSVVGPGNRLLHWRELQHYKGEGYHCYDFGGCDLDKASSHYRNTQFKLSFGGEVVEEPIVYLAKNPCVRYGFRAVGLLRRTVRAVPWPDRWLAALRTRPRMLSWLR